MQRGIFPDCCLLLGRELRVAPSRLALDFAYTIDSIVCFLYSGKANRCGEWSTGIGEVVALRRLGKVAVQSHYLAPTCTLHDRASSCINSSKVMREITRMFKLS